MKQTITIAAICLIIQNTAYAGLKDAVEAYKAKDYLSAARELKPLAEKGDPQAQVILGGLYLHGRGVQHDPGKALDLYKKAAAQGLASAQYNLGNAYFKGDLVPKDYQRAEFWYRKSADQGFAEAQNGLAILFLEGLGVTRDIQTGMAWLQKSAQKGYAKAQDNLGRAYREGIGVPIDFRTAEYWHRQAATQGDPQGLNNLGAMNELGLGRKKNLLLAYICYALSVKSGYNADNLSRLQTQLSGADLAKANRIVEHWVPGESLPSE